MNDGLIMDWTIIKARIIAVVGLLIVSTAGLSLLWTEIMNRRSSTIVSLADQGAIAAKDVSTAALLYDETTTWQFHESEYASLPRTLLTTPQQRQELLAILASAREGRQHRNHPSFVCRVILLTELNDQRKFYTYCEMHYDSTDENYFVVLDALLEGATNPNVSRVYESEEMVDFLRRNSPWVEEKLINETESRAH